LAEVKACKAGAKNQVLWEFCDEDHQIARRRASRLIWRLARWSLPSAKAAKQSKQALKG